MEIIVDSLCVKKYHESESVYASEYDFGWCWRVFRHHSPKSKYLFMLIWTVGPSNTIQTEFPMDKLIRIRAVSGSTILQNLPPVRVSNLNTYWGLFVPRQLTVTTFDYKVKTKWL